MARFPDLLRRAMNDCNRAGKPLGIAVLIVGALTVVMMLVLWRTILAAGMTELRAILGPDAAARVEDQVMGMTPGPEMQGAMMGVMAQIQEKLDALPEEEREQLIGEAMGRFIAGVAPMIGGFVLFSIILNLWIRSFFLVLGSRGTLEFGPLAGEALSWMLPVFAVGFLTGLAVFGWVLVLALLVGIAAPMLMPLIVVAGLASAVILWPRLALAPAILIQDRAGIIESIKRSFAITKGRWLKVIGNLIGVAAMVWLVTFVIQFFVNVIVGMAASFSPAATIIGQVMTFVGLIAVAYKTVFLVRLKESIALPK